jgi:hypothetical protein
MYQLLLGRQTLPEDPDARGAQTQPKIEDNR